jgi:CHAT domain-containing protein
MWRLVVCLFIGVFCAAAPCAMPRALAQLATKDTAEQQANEFARVYERWQQSRDPEQKIALAEQALQLEPGVVGWPLRAPRASVKGGLLFGLGSAYYNRRQGQRADNLEQAIAHFEAALTVFTPEALPQDWANTQINLAIAYWYRSRGDRADNLEKAIAAYEAALTVFKREALPQDWANTQNNLAIAYGYRIRGDRADNLEKAIAAYEAALTVRTREALPRQWAQTQNNLAIAYRDRIRGDRADNLEKAIAAYEAGLTVRTREAMPRDWADTQNNLANAYGDRIRGDRADNLEKAIAAYEAALAVTTREALPREWAQTQNNLAGAYRKRIRGDRADNLEKAIAAYMAALTVRTREALPREWAQTQNDLAMAYRERIRGDRADNLGKAIAGFEAALSVRTREALPRDHLRTATRLGQARLQKRDWRAAGTAYASARQAFVLLFGQGLEEAEAGDLIAEAGPLFAEAAYAAVQRGEIETALELASEGRARLMAVALKLQTLVLPDAQRQHLDALRAAIRTEERVEQIVQGADRAAALEKLIALRKELIGLVNSASSVQATPGSALAHARALVGTTVLVPVLTKVGTKILIVTATNVTVVDLPDLATDGLDLLIRGKRTDDKMGGWLGAYNINYLQGAEFDRRWPEWMSAIGDLGPALWRMGGERLHAALKDHGIKPGTRLAWLPTGALGILPMGLAQDPSSNRRFADDYEIVYAPSLEALAAAQDLISKTPQPSLAAIINPTGDLPGTEKEGAIVASHFTDTARTLLGQRTATPEAVLAALKGKTYWHFATHGSFSWSNARQSALLMLDRTPLTVGELLETDGLGRPRLVVLSACETGLYDITKNPDEFIGLPGTFTALGAAGVLGTLWPVSDDATALLMAKFYELHLQAGLAPPTALARAQAWLREATNEDLDGYARVAAEQGRLESRHLTEIAQALSTEGLARSRNRGLVAWIDAKPATDDGKTEPGAPKRLARPYAHPYFWAGFIYTGL